MSVVEFFFQAPPVTRTLVAATLTLSVLVHSGLISAYPVFFYLPFLLKFPPELWRMVSSFLLTGKGLGIIFDNFFLWTNGSKLETSSPRFSQPGDFFVYILFVCMTILGLNAAFVGGLVFTSALILALAYTSSQDDRGATINFIIVTIPAPWAPYAMLLMTLVTAGPQPALIQFTGLIAAHLYDFLTRIYPEFGGGRNVIQTPAFIRRMFATTEASVADRGHGTAFRPAQQPSSATASGSSAGGVLPESWRTRGSGHRLGGD